MKSGRAMDNHKQTEIEVQLGGGTHTEGSWNSTYPVGTAVRYWPVYPPSDSIPPVDTKTRSEAWTLGDGSVVVMISGKSGGVRLSHIEVLKEPTP